MSEHILESNGFCLRLVLNVFESDIEYPINTNMTVSVKNNEFSAKTDMDIDIKAFADFTDQLKKVYDTLSGEAMIKEPYGYQRYVSFQADKRSERCGENCTFSFFCHFGRIWYY